MTNFKDWVNKKLRCDPGIFTGTPTDEELHTYIWRLTPNEMIDLISEYLTEREIARSP